MKLSGIFIEGITRDVLTAEFDIFFIQFDFLVTTT